MPVKLFNSLLKILHTQYLNNLNETFLGSWFDGSRPLSFSNRSEEAFFAPDFVIRNSQLYKHLLFPEDNQTHVENNL